MNLFDRVFSAVLFDMDGTLVSSIAAVERSWQRLADEYGVPKSRLGVYHGIPAKQLIDRLLPDADQATKNQALERIIELETLDTEGIEILPGASEALARLTPANACAIVTSCSDGLASARLGVTDFELPNVIVTADDVAVGKPDPAPYVLGAQQMNLSASECLVVEDAPAGLESGRSAGAATLAVATTHQAHELDADRVVRDLSEVRFEATDAGVIVHRVSGS